MTSDGGATTQSERTGDDPKIVLDAPPAATLAQGVTATDPQTPAETPVDAADSRITTRPPVDDPLSEIFTREGIARYLACLTAYNTDLLNLSIRISRRSNADVTSAHHVDRANEALISGAGSRRAQARGVAGGVLTGVGGSAGIAALSASDNRGALVLIMLVGMVIGVALVVAAFSQRS